MKKFLLFLLTAILLLGACSNGEDNSSKTNGTEEDKNTEVDIENNVETENEENKAEPDSNQNKNDEEVAETPAENTEETKLYDIQLNSESNTLELIDAKGNSTVLSENSPSEPVKSPNGQMAAYISPMEWEELGDLYIVDLKSGDQKALVEADAENKPKNVIWKDDEHVLAIIGYPYGTVATGGNIYKINVASGEKEAVTNYDGKTQITDLRIENGVLHYSGIQYTDDIMNEHKDYSNQIELN